MGRVIALVLLVTMLLGTPSHATEEWVEAAATVAAATVSLQNLVADEAGMQSFETVCTAFAIDGARGLFLTAQHCIDKTVRVDYQVAWTVYENQTLDLAVVQSPGVKRVALKPRTDMIPTGLGIAAFGHAYGWAVPLFRVGVVSHPYMLVPEIKARFPQLDGRFLVTDFALIGGMSGGPIVDKAGHLVSINQMGNGVQGMGQPVDVILRATGAFWEGRN